MSKYHEWYEQLIQRAAVRGCGGKYSERHHIVPRALGGSNEKRNLVSLTYREHFLAHWLLVRMTSGGDQKKMRHALYRMSGSIPGRTVAGWQYAVARRAQRDAKLGTVMDEASRAKISAALRGNKLSLGFRHGEEMRRRNSERLRGNKLSLGFKHSQETLEKRGAASESTKAKMSASQKRRWSEGRGPAVSDETRAKMSASAKIKSPPTPETRRKLAAASTATWTARKAQK